MLETFNFRAILEYLPLYLQCTWTTVWLSGLSLLGALLIGVLACSMRLSSIKILSKIAGIYIEAIRSTPLLAQLYFLYFGLPSLGIRASETTTGIAALTFNSGAYMAEIIRSGIQAIPRGQVEASVASGLTYFQRMRFVILPQAIGMTIPPMLGQSIVLVKDSALLSLISIAELTRAGQVMASERFMPAEGYITSAIFYLILYFILKTVCIWSQNKLIYSESH